MLRSVIALFALLAACAPHSPPPAAPPPMRSPSQSAAVSPELSPALAPLAGWLGDWDSRDGQGSEHWIAAAGAIYGVVLRGDHFEVLVVDDGDGPGRPDGVLRLFAMPDGARIGEFRQRQVADGAATFADDTRDFPRTITYALTDDRAGLTAVLDGTRQLEVRFARGRLAPAPELEAADLAFAAATAQRGVDGWVAAFDPHGGMMRRSGRIEYAGIAEAMAPTLTSGRLAWAPIASGRAGELGFTVGKATFTAARAEDSWRSTYATIWRRQPDGSWKVLFDTGRIVQDL
jgi:ketosteroid isomerase-like protein